MKIQRELLVLKKRKNYVPFAANLFLTPEKCSIPGSPHFRVKMMSIKINFRNITMSFVKNHLCNAFEHMRIESEEAIIVGQTDFGEDSPSTVQLICY